MIDMAERLFHGTSSFDDDLLGLDPSRATTSGPKRN